MSIARSSGRTPWQRPSCPVWTWGLAPSSLLMHSSAQRKPRCAHSALFPASHCAAAGRTGALLSSSRWRTRKRLCRSCSGIVFIAPSIELFFAFCGGVLPRAVNAQGGSGRRAFRHGRCCCCWRWRPAFAFAFAAVGHLAFFMALRCWPFRVASVTP